MRNILLALGVLVLFAGLATAAPVPKALKKAKPLRARIEPLPGEKLHSVDWYEVPFAEAVEELERLSGLMFLSKDAPKLNVTLRAKDVCLWELFAQLDDILYPQGWVAIPKTQSFCTCSTDYLHRPLDRHKSIPFLKPDELDQRFPYAPAQMILDVGEKGIEAGETVRKGIEFAGFDVTRFGPDKLFVYGRVMDLQKFVDEMGDHIKK